MDNSITKDKIVLFCPASSSKKLRKQKWNNHFQGIRKIFRKDFQGVKKWYNFLKSR